MIGKDVIDQYLPTIGIECHVQLKTKTKLFSAVNNDAVDAEPNTLVSPICFGLPGVLPVLNEEAINLAIRAGIALNAKIARFSKFDRKHYFYPDLPKGYQITQFDQPTVGKGHVDVPVGNDLITVGITRAHLEEDAGKSTHPKGADYSLVDLNRAGTPLLEVVSEPDMHSAKEGRAFAQELYYLMKYADVSNVDLYQGNMRFDVNISVAKKGSSELGTRAEIKNLNSFKSVERCIDYEIIRQIELLEKGSEIAQETRGWDDAKQKTVSQRSKEDSHDYRYFPEPDVPPVIIKQSQIDETKKSMGQEWSPAYWRKMLHGANIGISETEYLLEAEVEFDDFSFLPLIKEHSDNEELVKFLVDWNVNVLIPLLRSGDFMPGKVDALKLEKTIYELIKAEKLSSTKAKLLFSELASSDEIPQDIEAFAAKHGFIQVSDAAEIGAIVSKVLKENEKAAQDVKDGEMRAIGFLVGQVMKESKGKANPQIATELIKKKLEG